MTDRELYRKLKKHKVYSRFCMSCAHAFCYKIENYDGLEYTFRDYLESTAKPLMEMDELGFIEKIRTWKLRQPYLRVLNGQIRKNSSI